MVDNNVQNIKFLRNGNVFTPSIDPVKTARQVALDAMEKQKENLADGTAILGRYKETDGVVKTLVGFAYISDDAKTLTVFDVDGAGAYVDKKIKTAIEALDADVTSSGGKNVQVKVTEEDGKIKAVNITTDNTVNSSDVATAIETEIGELEYSDSAVPGQYVSQVSQAYGKIAVVRVDLPDASSVSGDSKVLIDVTQDKGQIKASAANLSGVKLDGYSEAATTGDVASTDTLGEALGKLQKTIHEMDKAASAEDGKVVTTVSESDGKVSETKVDVKDLQLGGYVKGEQSGAISGTDTINIALSKIENNIAASQSATTVTNTDNSINVTTDATGTTIGVNINSGEKVISLGNDGIYTDIKLSAVTVSEANVKEAFALIASDGATQLGSTIKIYKDSSLLSVALLHADYSDPQNPVLPTYDKINGWTDIASPTQANQALCFAYENVEGNVVVAAVPVGSFINEQEFASGLTWDSTAGKVIGVVDSTSEKDSSKNSFLTVGADGFKVDGIKGEIDTKINALDATVGSTTVESGKHVAVQVVEDSGKLTALTVTETDIASAQGLADEITARKAVDGQSGQTYAANTGANYISGANSLNDADVKLDAALKAVDNAMLTGVVAGDGITVLDNGNKSQTISVKVKNDNGIVNDATGLHLGTIDCGTYTY